MILAPTLSAFGGSSGVVRPTFSRDFAGEKTLNNGTGPAITFTRASNATFFNASGVLQTASNDVPRFDHDPATGASRGLLIEEARTNLLTYSEEFDNAAWAKTNLITAGMTNTDTSPAGTTTADKIIEGTNNGIHETRQSVSIATTGNHTYSVFAKAAGRNFATFYVRETANSGATYVSAVVDLSNGTISGTPVGTASVTSVGNGWYRIVLTGSVDSGTRFWQMRLRQDAATASYAGDGASGVLLWGAQLEAGAFPTSYIATTNAAATRSADSAQIEPISSFFNESEGAIIAESIALGRESGGVVTVDDGSGTNRHIIDYNSSANPQVRVVVSSNQFAASYTGIATGSNFRLGLAYRANDFIAAGNGTLSAPDTLGSVPTGLTHFRIGRTSGTAAGRLNGHIRKIAYWPKRLSNTLLQQLTT